MITDEDKSKLRRLMELRETRDLDKVRAAASEKEYREYEADIFEELDGIEGALKLDLGEPWGVVSFHSRETVFARVIDEEALLEHYEQRAMKEEVTTASVRMKVLNEYARDLKEQGLEFPPGLTWTPRRGVTITRQKT